MSFKTMIEKITAAEAISLGYLIIHSLLRGLFLPLYRASDGKVAP